MSIRDYFSAIGMPIWLQHVLLGTGTCVVIAVTAYAMGDEVIDRINELEEADGTKSEQIEELQQSVEEVDEKVDEIKTRQETIATTVEMEAERNKEFRRDVNNKIDLILEKID